MRAPHIKRLLKNGERRVWARVTMCPGAQSDKRPESQGGLWWLASRIKIEEVLHVDERRCCMWMNRYEIEECDPDTQVLRNGAAFLRSFMNLIDSISDGWPYWSYGTKCSTDLQELVQTPRCSQQTVTLWQVKKARDKIITFLSRCKQTKDNPRVQQFIADAKQGVW
jgi:hypothetical protein